MTSIIKQGSQGYVVNEIVYHCSATPLTWMHNSSLADQVTEIRRWHVDINGWAREGYHWFIGRSGTILPGRPETMIGAGVMGHNRGVIHICLIGGHGTDKFGTFEQSYTKEQLAALLSLTRAIAKRTRIKTVTGHNEYASKACPGFYVPTFIGKQGGLPKLLGY